MFLVKFCVISGKLSWSASGVLIYLKINYLSAAPCTELGPCIGGRAGGGEGSTGSGSGLSGLGAHGAVYQCHGGLRAGHTHHCTCTDHGAGSGHTSHPPLSPG